MRKSLLLICCLLFSLINKAQSNLSQENPRAAVQKFLHYLNQNSYQPEKAAEVFNTKDKADAKDLAIKLRKYLDGKALYIDVDLLPSSNNYIDSVTKLSRVQILKSNPEIYLEKSGNQWYFSKETNLAIPILFDKLFPFGTELLIKLVPSLGHKKLFGLELWQYFGLAIIILISILVFKLFIILFEFFMGRVKLFSGYSFNDYQEQIKKAAKPLSLAVVFQVVYILVPAIQLPFSISYYVLTLLGISLPFYFMLFMVRAMDALEVYFKKVAAKTESTLDDQLIPLAKKTFVVLIIIGGVIAILNKLSFDITALLAGLSIGGIAFALAAQDTLKNFFGSVMIFLDKPFQIGDWITFSGGEGVVEEVGFRATRLRTFSNSVLYVPNGKISDMIVDNMGLRVYRRFKTHLTITYDTPIELIESFVEGLRHIADNYPSVKHDMSEVHFNELGSTSLNIFFSIYFDLPTLREELKAKHEILISIMNLAKGLGIQFAFPTQTIHIENLPGQVSLLPKYNTDKESLTKALNNFYIDFEKSIKKED